MSSINQRHAVILQEKIFKIQEKFRKGHFKSPGIIAKHNKTIKEYEEHIKKLQDGNN
jgi:hypothetical protein